MRALLFITLLAFSSAPALSQQNIQVDVMGEAYSSIEIGDIYFGDSLTTKAESYGHDEMLRLVGFLKEDLERALLAANWLGYSTDENRLSITIMDAVPNRPTMHQIQELDAAHYSNISPGGASLQATLINTRGEVIVEYSYVWTNTSLDEDTNYGTWTDARKAFSFFASNIAISLGDAPMPMPVS